MLNLISFHWKQRIFLFLFYSFIALAVLAPISHDAFIPGLADYINHLASIIQAKMAINEGQFFLRVAPAEHGGWRYPLFQFYSPSAYLFTGFIYKYLTPFNPIMAYKMTIWLFLVIGGIWMNRLAYWFNPSRPAAILASIVYLTSPYYIIVINNFGDLTETMALGLLPVVIYYTLQCYLHPNAKKIFLQVSLLWYLLLTIHIVTFLYTSLFIALLLLFITARNPIHWKNLMFVGLSYSFSFLLAMWYVAPISLLSQFLSVSTTFLKASDFINFNPVISQLLFSGGFNLKNAMSINHPAVGWIILFSAGICLYALINKSYKNDSRANYWVPALLFIFFIAFFMIWAPINFWQWMPNIMLIGQYSWRFLGQIIWIGSLLFAWAVCWLFHNKLDRRHVILGTLVIVITTSAWFPTILRSGLDLKEFSEKPFLIYNSNAYLLDFNKYTKFVSLIDSMLLYSLMEQNNLQLDKIYTIPKTLLNYAIKPVITLNGDIFENLSRKEQLTAFINGIPIATKNLTTDKFHWDIPLQPVIQQYNKDLTLQFKSTLSDPINKQSHIDIKIETITLSGFLRPKETLFVNNVKKHCYQKKATTVCEINVPESTKIIELPVFYYPKLLNITLNGKSIPYQSVLYQGYLLAGITPEPGKKNIIQIRFQGLHWANIVSGLSWSLWGILFIILLFHQLKNKSWKIVREK